MGIAMVIDETQGEYLSDVDDVQIGWAVSPILAQEDLQPNEYSGAANFAITAAVVFGLLAAL